jgi:4-hydroxy-3-methylbut-2-enyl diphosphate reductase
MDVEIAEYAGYCFGVKRALNLVRKALSEKTAAGKKVYTLGSIIHNPGVVRELSDSGLISVNRAGDIEEGSIFVVRSHGMSSAIIKILKKKNIEIIDATCPFVKKAQSRARRLAEDGFHVAIVGDKDHPEVCGIREQVDKDNISVVNTIEDLKALADKNKIGIVVQTTQTMEKLKDLTCRLLDISKELFIVNTICDTTKKRQDSVRELSKKADVMLVVGGKNSANTTHLADISSENNPNTFHIEDSRDIKRHWFKNTRKVGISGGASTPEKDILEIKKKIEELKL